MLYRIAPFVLAATILVACSDHAPPTASMVPSTGLTSNLSLTEQIQQQIDAMWRKGHHASVSTRWRNVQRKKNGGDMAAAAEQYNALAAWIASKSGDIVDQAGLNDDQAAAMLVLNMARWLYDGPSAEPVAPPGQDVAIAIAPAGEAFTLRTPSEHAGVTWGAGSTNEDRVVVLAQDPNPYPVICSGPLVTRRCQYPLFYHIDFYPKIGLINPGRAAICMVHTGDRRPLEYPGDEAGARPIDQRLRLAHNLPANPADYTPGAIQEDGIEILPRSSTQSGDLIDCETHDHTAMNPVMRSLYLASQFVGKVISPRNAWAWDAGPEHDFRTTSSFNGVDYLSEPDLSISALSVAPGAAATASTYTVSVGVVNASRRTTGHATAHSAATTLQLYRSADGVLGPEDTLFATAAVPALAPDEPAFTTSVSYVSPSGNHYIVAKVVESATEVSTSNNVAAAAVMVNQPTGQQEQPLFDAEQGNWGIGGGPNSQQKLAQVFTAGMTGTLVNAQFPVSCDGGALIVELRGVDAGVPDGTLLASDSVSAAMLAMQDSFWKTFTFTPAVTVQSGVQYSLVLRAADPDAHQCSIPRGPVGDPYAFGDASFDARPNTAGVWILLMSDRKDLPFKTYVSVPVLH